MADDYEDTKSNKSCSCWVQLVRWSIDRLHVELIGRQTQLHFHPQTNIDGLIRILIHDDAYRDETASLGTSKLRVYSRLVIDRGRHAPMDELEPYTIVHGLGTDGRLPLIVVAPFEPLQLQDPYQPFLPSVSFSNIQNDPLLALQQLHNNSYNSSHPNSDLTDHNDLMDMRKSKTNSRRSKIVDESDETARRLLEEKREADRIRQRKCRARKKQKLQMEVNTPKPDYRALQNDYS
ncbi:hypothetical protein BC833DRAFT_585811 [Globomyces pollinis-pini]|nr:hypothetical protein BC833DRAFT_585811 [Globomyces pollinis-pini]